MKTASIGRDGFSRRNFIANTSALGAASFLGLPLTAAAEPPPETKKIRFVHVPAICLAPQYLAEELLRLEGFSEVEYVEITRQHGIQRPSRRSRRPDAERGSGPRRGAGRQSGRYLARRSACGLLRALRTPENLDDARPEGETRCRHGGPVDGVCLSV